MKILVPNSNRNEKSGPCTIHAFTHSHNFLLYKHTAFVRSSALSLRIHESCLFVSAKSVKRYL